jgi:hypothetical protein
VGLALYQKDNPMEPETQNPLTGVGRKNPTIHVLDSLMGMGKSTD